MHQENWTEIAHGLAQAPSIADLPKNADSRIGELLSSAVFTSVPCKVSQEVEGPPHSPLVTRLPFARQRFVPDRLHPRGLGAEHEVAEAKVEERVRSRRACLLPAGRTFFEQ